MNNTALVLLSIALIGVAGAVSAQNKYDQFLAQYVASVQISNACSGITALDPKAASAIAKNQDGLRKQKVLRIIYYGNTDSLVKMGNAQLAARGVNSSNKKDLCRFGRTVSGETDTIGRFLRKK